MTRNVKAIFPLVLLLLFAACAKKEDAKPAGKQYPMQGVIKALDPSTHTATIDAGKIGDWMEAMTMEYPVKDPAEFNKLHSGDKINATVFVQGNSYWVGEIHEDNSAPAAK